MAWNHEQFAFSVLPRNFQTDDILRRSCLEALKQEGLSMFQVLASLFESEGKDRAPNKESSIIQKARAIVRVASWNRGHDVNFSSAGTERNSMHHCEEHWLPKCHPGKLQRRLTTNTKYSTCVAARDLVKKLCSTHFQKFKKALLRFIQLYIKTLPGFCCSVSQSCLTPCDPMNLRMPGFPVHHHFPKLAQTRSIGLLMTSNHLVLCHTFCSCLQYFPLSGCVFSFFFFVCFCFCFSPMSWLFPSGGQSIGLSASVLPLNIQGWFPLGLTGWISLQSKGHSRVFSSTTVRNKDQFFGTQPSLWFSSSICI